jgi:hypothetical protein
MLALFEHMLDGRCSQAGHRLGKINDILSAGRCDCYLSFHDIEKSHPGLLRCILDLELRGTTAMIHRVFLLVNPH